MSFFTILLVFIVFYCFVFLYQRIYPIYFVQINWYSIVVISCLSVYTNKKILKLIHQPSISVPSLKRRLGSSLSCRFLGYAGNQRNLIGCLGDWELKTPNWCIRGCYIHAPQLLKVTQLVSQCSIYHTLYRFHGCFFSQLFECLSLV